MGNNQQLEINGDELFLDISQCLFRFRDSRSWHELQASMKKVALPEYLASMLTQAVQQSVDFRFEKNYPWNSVFTVLRPVCEDLLGNGRSWREEAKERKQPFRDFEASRILQYVVEIIELNEYCRQPATVH